MTDQNDSDQAEAAKRQARKIKIDREALKEWRALPDQVRQRFKKKLEEALNNQSPTGKELRGYPGFYRLKMKRPNYRLVYRWLEDGRIAIAVVIVESREKVYEKMKARIANRSDDDA